MAAVRQPGDEHETVVHVLRHGEVRNPDGVLYGRLPGYQLSENGQAMAAAVAEALADVPLRVLRTSPLERARQTIAPLAAMRPELEVEVDERLVEASNRFEGQVFGPRNAALRNPKNWLLLLNPLRPSWGESYRELAERMTAAIADAARAAGPGGQALLVSHQLPIWMARSAAEGRNFVHDPRRRECTLASITSFHFLDDRLIEVSYAEPVRDLLRESPSSNFSAGS